MTYAQTLDYLYASQPAFHLVGAAAYKPGFDNTYRLMHHLGDPHLRFRSVHIAGTNGKGSTSHLIAAALQAAGYRVGLYTSPHLVDFRERICISGQMISEERVVQFVEENRAFLEEVRPSFFETAMAMAFAYFAEQQVDVAVIEVGLGGRLDSTNIITPLLSVITNIGMDHTEFLGNTLAAIAGEKAGIIKSGVPCVIGETDPETAPVFMARARECGILGEGLETTDCRLWFADQCGYLCRRRQREVSECQLHGIYQDKNIQTAYVALQVLNTYTPLHVLPSAVADGFAHVCIMTGLRGRWEVLCEQPLTICDTGHNSHGIRYVSEQLQALLTSREGATLHIVFGMVSDKDVDVVLRLMPTRAHYYFTQARTHRAIPASDLQTLWLQLHNDYPADWCRSYTSVRDAIYAATLATHTAIPATCTTAATSDIIFIGGSNYIVGEALQILG